MDNAMRKLTLISHNLCPYVQRALIVAAERGLDVERIDIDLANKPDWFLDLSPTGKTPLLLVRENGIQNRIFESAVIAEYFDEIGEGAPLLPADPLVRARHRAWVDFASGSLDVIARLYNAQAEEQFVEAAEALYDRLAMLDAELKGPWFDGDDFGLVDAAFGPVFRYFSVFEQAAGWSPLKVHPRLAAWADTLMARPSIGAAVGADYARLLTAFVMRKQGWLAGLIERHMATAQ